MCSADSYHKDAIFNGERGAHHGEDPIVKGEGENIMKTAAVFTAEALGVKEPSCWECKHAMEGSLENFQEVSNGPNL